MNRLTALSLLYTLLILIVVYLALSDTLTRPRDMRRMARAACRFLALPLLALAASILAAVILAPPRQDGHWMMLLDFAAPRAVFLMLAAIFLPMGSIWAWRAGLRGRRFGWLGLPALRLRQFPWKTFLIAAGAINLWTILLYLAFPTRPQPEFQEVLRKFEAAGTGFAVLIAVAVLTAPFHEEALFRHYLQNRLDVFLSRYGLPWWIALAAVSALWALGHVGMVERESVRFCQIFGAGILLGWCQKRHGVGLAVAVHFSLNLGVLFYTPLLVSAG